MSDIHFCCKFLLYMSSVHVCCTFLLNMSSVHFFCTCLLSMSAVHVHYTCLLHMSANMPAVHVCCTYLLYMSAIHICCTCLLYRSAVHKCYTCLLSIYGWNLISKVQHRKHSYVWTLGLKQKEIKHPASFLISDNNFQFLLHSFLNQNSKDSFTQVIMCLYYISIPNILKTRAAVPLTWQVGRYGLTHRENILKIEEGALWEVR